MSSLQEKAKFLLRAVGEPEVNWRYKPLDWVTGRISRESVSKDIESLQRMGLIGVLDRYIESGQRVLEAGFGKGKFMHYFASKGCLVIGIENQPILAEQLKVIKPEFDLGGLMFSFFPIATLPSISTMPRA